MAAMVEPNLMNNLPKATVGSSSRPANNTGLGARRPSAFQLPPGEVTMPPKKTRKSTIQNPSVMSLKLEDMASRSGGTTRSHMSVMSSRSTATSRASGTSRASAAPGGAKHSLATPKRNKDEIGEYYTRIKKNLTKFDRTETVNDYYTALGKYNTMNSDESTIDGDFTTMTKREILEKIRKGDVFSDAPPKPKYYAWKQRWCLDKSGRHSGQIKGVKDVCVLRNGKVAVTESINSRIQIFKKNSGTSVLTLGDTNESMHDSLRRIQPTGLCEMRKEDNVLLVTDKNRVLLLDTASRSKIIGDVKIKDKTDLRGIAMTQSDQMLICEVGMQPSVGFYESSGNLVRQLPCRDFRTPSYISWSDEYEVCAVADSEQHCVLLYDAKGKYLNRFGSPQQGSTAPEVSLVYPSGLAWLPEGRLLVADRSGNKVVLFDLRNMGACPVLTRDEHGIQNPVALASNSRNRIVLSEEFLDFGTTKSRLKMFKLDEVEPPKQAAQ